MTEVIRAAVALQAFCESHQWRFCFIGGLALLRWGEPRETVDVEGIIIRQTGHLNWDSIHRQLQPLTELKDAPEIMTELRRRRMEFEQ